MVLIYISAFEFMYLNRVPAANMAYFGYTDNVRAESFFYYFFYPAYWVQRRVFGFGQTHTWDREPVIFPSDFKG